MPDPVGGRRTTTSTPRPSVSRSIGVQMRTPSNHHNYLRATSHSPTRRANAIVNANANAAKKSPRSASPRPRSLSDSCAFFFRFVHLFDGLCFVLFLVSFSFLSEVALKLGSRRSAFWDRIIEPCVACYLLLSVPLFFSWLKRCSRRKDNRAFVEMYRDSVASVTVGHEKERRIVLLLFH